MLEKSGIDALGFQIWDGATGNPGAELPNSGFA
jgi:hypothetical protein